MRAATERLRSGALLAALLLSGCTVVDQEGPTARTAATTVRTAPTIARTAASTMEIVPPIVLAFEIAEGSDEARTDAVRQLLDSLSRFGLQKCDPGRPARTELLIDADAATQRATIRFRELGSIRTPRWVVLEIQIIGDGFPNRSNFLRLVRRSVSLWDENGDELPLGAQQLADNWRDIAPALQDCARLSAASLNDLITLIRGPAPSS